jgi:TolB-like protein
MLLDRPGEVVTREELRRRLWAPDVFVDFEHGLNKSVQKLRDALGDSADSPLYIETIPRVGYRFVAPVSARPRQIMEEDSRVALNGGAFAAVSVQIPGATSGTSVPQQRKRKLLSVASAGLVAALAAASVLLIVKQPQRIAPIHSLAVIPLDNLSGDSGQNYFADGMTDELTTMLAKDSTLRVVSRTSAMQYKGAHRPLREIAQALGVDGVLEGSVERNGDKVHMTLQLIDGPSDTHVWAESYDRDANDLVSLPDDAAMAIAKRTNSAVAGRAAARYVNPAAHDAYLHGRYLWFRGNDEAGKYFKRATELQPDYALAWTGVSDYYGQSADGIMDPAQALPQQEAAAKRAVQLDDTLAQAHLSLCAAFFFAEWDWARADRECVRAIDLNPQFAEAWHFRGKIFSTLNRHEEAIATQKKAMELDPYERPWGLAYMYMRARNYDAVIEDARQRLESNPRDPTMYYMMAGAYRGKGMLAEAAQAWEKGLMLDGKQSDAESMRRAYQRGGYRAVVLWKIAELKKQSYVSPVEMALQYAELGDRERALSLLEEGYRHHSPMLLEIQDDPAYDFLHSDERYRALIRKIGLPPAW